MINKKNKDKIIEYPLGKKPILNKTSADTFFKYMTKVEYLVEIIKRSSIAPRYLIEDIDYLNINWKTVAIPMVCFCDIPLAKVGYHMKRFGNFGIGLDKNSLLCKSKLQPIHYINNEGEYIMEYRKVFLPYIEKIKVVSNNDRDMLNFIYSMLMYIKPIYDRKENANRKDECEWRYIPIKKLPKDFNLIYVNDKMNDEKKSVFSNKLKKIKKCHIPISLNDIKYLVVNNEKNRTVLINEIEKIHNIKRIDKNILYSKIITISNINEDVI